jgi:putative transcriptional regulator
MKNRLKELRLERGWSQGALADELDVSRQTVNALEFRIARLFGLSIEHVFIEEETR